MILRARPMYLSVTDVPTVVRKRGGQDQSVVLPSLLYVRAIPERGGGVPCGTNPTAPPHFESPVMIPDHTVTKTRNSHVRSSAFFKILSSYFIDKKPRNFSI